MQNLSINWLRSGAMLLGAMLLSNVMLRSIGLDMLISQHALRN